MRIEMVHKSTRIHWTDLLILGNGNTIWKLKYVNCFHFSHGSKSVNLPTENVKWCFELRFLCEHLISINQSHNNVMNSLVKFQWERVWWFQNAYLEWNLTCVCSESTSTIEMDADWQIFFWIYQMDCSHSSTRLYPEWKFNPPYSIWPLCSTFDLLNSMTFSPSSPQKLEVSLIPSSALNSNSIIHPVKVQVLQFLNNRNGTKVYTKYFINLCVRIKKQGIS